MNVTDRRQFLARVLACASPLGWPRSAWSQPRLAASPFGLGVASGSPGADSVVLLQSRPETVWSRKPRDQVTTGNSRGMAGLVHTLVRGVSVKTTK